VAVPQMQQIKITLRFSLISIFLYRKAGKGKGDSGKPLPLIVPAGTFALSPHAVSSAMVCG
jgi:hypothetical protein